MVGTSGSLDSLQTERTSLQKTDFMTAIRNEFNDLATLNFRTHLERAIRVSAFELHACGGDRVMWHREIILLCVAFPGSLTEAKLTGSEGGCLLP